MLTREEFFKLGAEESKPGSGGHDVRSLLLRTREDWTHSISEGFLRTKFSEQSR
jgi:hypothetical protein